MGKAGGVSGRHLDLHRLIGVQCSTVPSGLLDELLSVGKNQGLRGILRGRRHSTDQMTEDDLSLVR